MLLQNRQGRYPLVPGTRPVVIFCAAGQSLWVWYTSSRLGFPGSSPAWNGETFAMIRGIIRVLVIDQEKQRPEATRVHPRVLAQTRVWGRIEGDNGYVILSA